MNQNCKNFQTIKKNVGRKVVLSFNPKGIYFLLAIFLLTIVLQSLILNVQGKALLRSKKTLKLLQNPPSLIKFRHKRESFTNERQAEDYYDDNYDILPDLSAGSQPPTVADKISEQAQQVAESFKKMWQSMTDSVQHCIDALRAMFGESPENEDLTPEQEQEILADLQAKYRRQQEYNNEIRGRNIYDK